MQKNDGKGYYPFVDDCDRLENGMQTTNVPLKSGQKKPDPKTAFQIESESSNIDELRIERLARASWLNS